MYVGKYEGQCDERGQCRQNRTCAFNSKRDYVVSQPADEKTQTDDTVHTIMTAANTVSRASVDADAPPESIRDTTSDTSITVTATASTRDPNGSPTRCATTSA